MIFIIESAMASHLCEKPFGFSQDNAIQWLSCCFVDPRKSIGKVSTAVGGTLDNRQHKLIPEKCLVIIPFHSLRCLVKYRIDLSLWCPLTSTNTVDS